MSDTKPRIYSTVEIPSHVPGIGYTLKHRKAVELLIQYYCSRAVGKKDGYGNEFTALDCRIMQNRAKCHDMDKVLTSLSYPQLTADYFHRMFNGHHIGGFVDNPTKYDWLEMIFDWESAPYTKPDKGMNANGVLETFNAHLAQYCAPYLQLFGFNNSAPRVVEEIKAKCNKPVYESDLIEAILNYIHTTHIPQLEYTSRMDDTAFMKLYNKPVPYRHPSTQKPNGTIHERPNAYSKTNSFASKHEMINGLWDAQMFDFDKICLMTKSDIVAVEEFSKQAICNLEKSPYRPR